MPAARASLPTPPTHGTGTQRRAAKRAARSSGRGGDLTRAAGLYRRPPSGTNPTTTGLFSLLITAGRTSYRVSRRRFGAIMSAAGHWNSLN